MAEQQSYFDEEQFAAEQVDRDAEYFEPLPTQQYQEPPQNFVHECMELYEFPKLLRDCFTPDLCERMLKRRQDLFTHYSKELDESTKDELIEIKKSLLKKGALLKYQIACLSEIVEKMNVLAPPTPKRGILEFY